MQLRENAKLTVGTQESSITSGSGGQGGGSITNAGSGADAMAHTHSNKGVLDKITEQDYADFKGAVNKAHIHANKDTLDKIEQPYTTAERDKLAWLENYTHPTHTAHAKGFYKFASDGEGHVTDAGSVTKEDITALGIPDKDTNTTYKLVQDGIAIKMVGSDRSGSEVGLKPTITKGFLAG